jgi:protocatechuate 3,4-dioxygenase beta subunit
MNTRRHLLLTATTVAAVAAMPALATTRRSLVAMTDGPFYPPRGWRERNGAQDNDWDADLTRVQRRGRVLEARGDRLGLDLVVADTGGRLIDGAEVEIWQCDALASYRHPRVPAEAGRFDEGFQGFGAARSDRQGALAFQTIRPVPYPGRTPHIHVKLRHPAFGEISSQLFVAGDPGNAGDFLWRAVDAKDRAGLEMQLQPAAAASGLKWTARHVLTVPS